MAATDEWFVRLPDGSVVLARSTAAVRHHLETGRLPRDIQVRRAPSDPWGLLERFDVFADLAPPRPRSANRGADGNSTGSHANLQLEAVGVRGFLDHLWTALEGTLQPLRLRTAALLGGCGGAALAVTGLTPLLPSPWALPVTLGVGLAAWLVQGWVVMVLTRLTFVELSQLRPATLREAVDGLGGRLTHYLLAQLVLGGVAGGVLLALRLPTTLSLPEYLAWLPVMGTVLRLVLETALWLLLGVGVLLAPVVVVEECSAWQALRQWHGLWWQHPGRVLLFEALALVLALVLAAPLLLAVVVAGWSVAAGSDGAGAATLTVLGGLALTPALAFLVVANVYIYVNLRYEVGGRG